MHELQELNAAAKPPPQLQACVRWRCCSYRGHVGDGTHGMSREAAVCVVVTLLFASCVNGSIEVSFVSALACPSLPSLRAQTCVRTLLLLPLHPSECRESYLRAGSRGTSPAVLLRRRTKLPEECMGRPHRLRVEGLCFRGSELGLSGLVGVRSCASCGIEDL